MTEDELLLSVIDDKINECEQNSVITCTDFLDLRKQSISVGYLKYKKGVKWLLYGGYSEAERKMIVFLPFYVDDFYEYINNSPEDNPITVFRADKDGFSSLNHRDYLGALTGLGIKREKTGDIIVDDKGCYIFLKPSVADYVLNNLISVGRGTVSIKKLESEDSFSYVANTVEKLCFVQSVRLDSICSAVFSLSRSNASQFIEKGLVFVNDEQIFKPDYHFKEGQKIVIKGKGRAIIRDTSGKSKKGRIAVVVDVFI